jgi:branched-chain amino acid transport system ATP-binding protein
LAAGYGSVTIVRGFDLDVAAGTVVAILGPNGSGKTTLLTTMAGLLPRMGGDLRINGASIPSGRPSLCNRAGIVLVPDDRALFGSLTVEENIAAARSSSKRAVDDVMSLFPALQARRKLDAGSLSGGEQQMLAMARALVQGPSVLLVDEMSMGLAPAIVENLLSVVRRIADDTGAVVILVEQHVRLALEVADVGIVLVHGEGVLRGSASDLAGDPAQLEAAYLGETTSVPAARWTSALSADAQGPLPVLGRREVCGSTERFRDRSEQRFTN